jgi:hypothetical protein
MGEDLNQEGKSMISQGILRFKIEHTEEQITPRSGLALFAEVIRAFDVRRMTDILNFVTGIFIDIRLAMVRE